MSQPITVTVTIGGVLAAAQEAVQPASPSTPEVPAPAVGEVLPAAPADEVPHTVRTMRVVDPEARPELGAGLTDLQRATAEALAAFDARERGAAESDCVCDHHVVTRWMRDPRWDAAKASTEGRQLFPVT